MHWFINTFLAGHSLCLLFLLAFHILKDTTVKFTLEKVHVAEDAQFTFYTSGESCSSTELLKVDGRFVNPVQVCM